MEPEELKELLFDLEVAARRADATLDLGVSSPSTPQPLHEILDGLATELSRRMGVVGLNYNRAPETLRDGLIRGHWRTRMLRNVEHAKDLLYALDTEMTSDERANACRRQIQVTGSTTWRDASAGAWHVAHEFMPALDVSGPRPRHDPDQSEPAWSLYREAVRIAGLSLDVMSEKFRRLLLLPGYDFWVRFLGRRRAPWDRLRLSLTGYDEVLDDLRLKAYALGDPYLELSERPFIPTWDLLIGPASDLHHALMRNR